MVDTHFKSEQNQFLHLDTEKILSAPLYILLDYSLIPTNLSMDIFDLKSHFFKKDI